MSPVFGLLPLTICLLLISAFYFCLFKTAYISSCFAYLHLPFLFRLLSSFNLFLPDAVNILLSAFCLLFCLDLAQVQFWPNSRSLTLASVTPWGELFPFSVIRAQISPRMEGKIIKIADNEYGDLSRIFVAKGRRPREKGGGGGPSEWQDNDDRDKSLVEMKKWQRDGDFFFLEEIRVFWQFGGATGEGTVGSNFDDFTTGWIILQVYWNEDRGRYIWWKLLVYFSQLI